MLDFQINQGDSLPVLSSALTYSDGSAADLTGATVLFVLRDPATQVVYLTNPATVVLPDTAGYTFNSTDTATPGEYLGQFQVTFPGGAQQTFPTDSYLNVRINPSLTGLYTPQPAGYRCTDALRDVRMRLGSRGDNLNKIGAPVQITDQAVTFQYATNGIARGVRFSAGFEDFYVWDTPNAAKNAPVQRGFNNTNPLVHAVGELVLVSPQFSDADILRALNAELLAFPGKGLFRVRTADYITDPILHGYPLPSDLIEQELLDLSWLAKTNLMYRPEDTNYRVALDVPTVEFPTGNALFFYELPMPGQPFRVTYKAPFSTLQLATDVLLDVCGLPASINDLLVLGAAIRLLDSQPPRRADMTAQGDVRRTDEARVAEILTAAQGLRMEYADRLSDEVASLNGQFAPLLARRSLM